MPDVVKKDASVDAVASATARLIYVGAAVVIVGSVLLFVLFLLVEWTNSNWNHIAFNHFPAAVGLPAAAAAAFAIVGVFRTTEGQIKLEVPGFKFEGAAGPIIMWIMCFLAIAGAIRLTWPLTLTPVQ